MKIGIIGVGNIGKTLALKLGAAGHDIKVANSRGPDTISEDVLAGGARAVTTREAVVDVDVVILSIPFGAIPGLAAVLKDVGDDVVVIDTSNYYPQRDGRIEAVDAGMVESLWVTAQLGRPVVKSWNAVLSASLINKGQPAGSADRIALPVAADDDTARRVGLQLVEETGFDAVDAGTLAGSWRQQPGAPAYCTDLTRDELTTALAMADVSLLPGRRDAAIAQITKRFSDGGADDVDLSVLNRSLYIDAPLSKQT